MSEKRKSSIDWAMLAVGVLVLAMGVLFIVFPDKSSNIICTVLGICLFVTALVLIISVFAKKSKNIAASITLAFLAVLVGIFCFTNRADVQGLLQIFFALVLVYNGVTALVEGVQRLRAKAQGSGLFILILGIIITALGCIVLFGSFDFVIVLMGISLIVDGITLAIMAFMTKKKEQVVIE